jgi:hypothetical protein
VVPYLNPYSANPLRLDLSDMDLDIDIDNTSQTLVPRAGAVVQATFARRPGRMVLISGKLDNGKPLPFAAQVLDEQQIEVGLVGQGGQAQARLLKNSGVLYVKWGTSGENTCAMPYTLPQAAPTGAQLTRLQAVCVAQLPQPNSTDTARTQPAPSPTPVTQQTPVAPATTTGQSPAPNTTPLTQQTPATPATTTGQGPPPPLATTRTRGADSAPPPLRSGLRSAEPLLL